MNIKALAKEHPESREVLRKLESLLKKHRPGSVITPKELARNVPVDAKALSDALTLLIDAGVLRQVYKVTTPSGVLTEEEFDDPRQIPEQLSDMWEHHFDTAESDIVPVFKRVA
ncbi:MAG: hypothetical protein LC794_01630 [Acidobacteria bacterium]|nr:hypothetical protein [Acidobacteriota bacterium]